MGSSMYNRTITHCLTPILTLAQRADPAPDCGDMLAHTEVDPLHECGVDVPAMRSQHGIDSLQGAKHDAVTHPHQATAACGLDDLRIEQLWERHPTWPGGRALRLPARWLHPLPIVREQGHQILPKSVGEKQRGTVGG